MTEPTPSGRNVRGPDGRFVRTLKGAKRDAEAAQLRSRGMSFRAIASELGYSNPGTAHAAVSRALAAVVAEPAAEVREHMVAQLDYLTEKALEVLEAQHVVVQQGRIVYQGDKPLTDNAPVLDAIQTLLKIQERRAKLLGLDAPKKVEVITLDWLDAQIAGLSAEVDQRAAAAEAPDAAGVTSP